MAIPVLKLNLVPPPTLWRRHHNALSWAFLGVGLVALGSVAFLTTKAYLKARKAGQQIVTLSAKAQKATKQQNAIQDELRAIDVTAEQPRWRLAERILTERSLPWSRITAELERSSVANVRLKTIQRVRPATGQGVQVKLKGEASTREAEVAYIESLQANAFFQTPVFEREAERQGGGIEFEITLPVSMTPPKWEPLPKYGPKPKEATPAKVLPPPPVKAAPKPQAPPKPAVNKPAAQPPAAAPSETPARRPRPQASGDQPSDRPTPRAGQDQPARLERRNARPNRQNEGEVSR